MPTFVGRDEGWLKALPQAFGYGFLYLFTCCCFSDKSDIGMGSEPGASPISPPAAALNESSATTLDSPDMSLSRLTATDRSGRTLELSASASHGNSGPPSRATSIGVPEDYVSNADSIDDILLYKQNADLTIDDVDERQISYPSGASATDELPLAPLDPSLQSAAAPLVMSPDGKEPERVTTLQRFLAVKYWKLKKRTKDGQRHGSGVYIHGHPDGRVGQVKMKTLAGHITKNRVKYGFRPSFREVWDMWKSMKGLLGNDDDVHADDVS